MKIDIRKLDLDFAGPDYGGKETTFIYTMTCEYARQIFGDGKEPGPVGVLELPKEPAILKPHKTDEDDPDYSYVNAEIILRVTDEDEKISEIYLCPIYDYGAETGNGDGIDILNDDRFDTSDLQRITLEMWRARQPFCHQRSLRIVHI